MLKYLATRSLVFPGKIEQGWDTSECIKPTKRKMTLVIHILAAATNLENWNTWMSHSKKKHNLWQREILLLIFRSLTPGEKTSSLEIARRIDIYLKNNLGGKRYSYHSPNSPTATTQGVVEWFCKKARHSLEKHGLVKIVRA